MTFMLRLFRRLAGKPTERSPPEPVVHVSLGTASFGANPGFISHELGDEDNCRPDLYS